MSIHNANTTFTVASVPWEGRLRVEVVRDLSGLEYHAMLWNKLALAAPQCQPQLSHAWVASYLEHRLNAGDSWRVVFAYEGSQLLGVACIIIKPHPLFRHLWVRLCAPFDSHTRAGDLLLAQDNDRTTLEALLTTLWQEVPSALGLHLHGVHEHSRTLSALPQHTSSGWIILRMGGDFGSFVPMNGTFEAFETDLSGNFRANLRKARNKLRKLQNVTTDVLRGAEASAAHFARFSTVEASNWKGRQGTALGQSPELIAFYTMLAQRLAAQGWLEWHFLNAEDKTIAGHLAIHFGDSLALIKIGYDETYAKYAPGNMLFEQTVQRVFAEGRLQIINCQSDMKWHRNWHMEQAEHYDVWFFPIRFLPILFGALPTLVNIYVRRYLRPLCHRLRTYQKRFRNTSH